MDCPVGDKHKLEYLMCTPGVCNKEDNPDVPEWCVPCCVVGMGLDRADLAPAVHAALRFAWIGWARASYLLSNDDTLITTYRGKVLNPEFFAVFVRNHRLPIIKVR